MNKFLPVRSFQKIWSVKSDAISFAAEMDAGFDAGEFSGPMHGERAEGEYEATLRYVAERFEMESKELENLIYAYGMEQFERYYPYH